MHHRVSGYNRAAMSERRKIAAWERQIKKVTLAFKIMELDFGTVLVQATELAIQAFNNATLQLDQVGKLVLSDKDG